MNYSPVMHILHQTLIVGILNVLIFCIKFYGCFELHIALCVLGLKEMSVNLTENVFVIFYQCIIIIIFFLQCNWWTSVIERTWINTELSWIMTLMSFLSKSEFVSYLTLSLLLPCLLKQSVFNRNEWAQAERTTHVLNIIGTFLYFENRHKPFSTIILLRFKLTWTEKLACFLFVGFSRFLTSVQQYLQLNAHNNTKHIKRSHMY